VLWYSLPMSVVVLMFGLSGHVCDVLALESSVQPWGVSGRNVCPGSLSATGMDLVVVWL